MLKQTVFEYNSQSVKLRHEARQEKNKCNIPGNCKWRIYIHSCSSVDIVAREGMFNMTK